MFLESFFKFINLHTFCRNRNTFLDAMDCQTENQMQAATQILSWSNKNRPHTNAAITQKILFCSDVTEFKYKLTKRCSASPDTTTKFRQQYNVKIINLHEKFHFVVSRKLKQVQIKC